MKPSLSSFDSSDSTPALIDFSQAYIILREKWALIAVGLILGLGISGWMVRSKPKRYSATTVVQMEPQARILNHENEAPQNPVTDAEIQTLLETLQSRPLLRNAAESLDLANDPLFSARPISLDEATDELSFHFFAKQRRGIPLINITASHADPTTALRISKGISEALLAHFQTIRTEAFQTTLTFLKTETERQKIRLQKSEEALQSFREQNNAVSLEEKQDTVTSALKTQAANLASAHSNRIRLETDFSEIERLREQPELLLSVASVSQHPGILSQRAQIEELQNRVQTLKLRYTEKHPRLAEALGRLHESQNSLWRQALQIPETLRSELERAIATEQSFQIALQEQEKESMALNRQAIAYSVLARDVDTDRSLYQAILKRLKESDVEVGAPPKNIRIFEEAKLPRFPESRKTIRTLFIGGMFGGLLSSAVVLVLCTLRSTWRSVEELEEKTHLPVLASIPRHSGMSNQKNSDSRGVRDVRIRVETYEAFRSLRTTLHSRSRRQRSRCLLFTSALPCDGKTSSTLGYAITLAQQGFRTLLVDGDIRTRSLTEILMGKSSHQGLTDIINGLCKSEAAIAESHIPSLRILPAGISDSSGFEHLSQKNIVKILEELRDQYDYIIIDSPPVLPVSDALILASAVDAICVVVRYGSTPKKDLLRALNILADTGTPIEGIILNAVSSIALPKYDSRDLFRGPLPPALQTSAS